MDKNRLILITNPGSSSRKYALYKGGDLLCSLHFEFEGKAIVYTIKKADGSEKKKKCDFKTLAATVSHLEEILVEEGFLGGPTKLDAILARIVAPGSYFSKDHLVDEECLKELEIAKKKAPLHIPVVAAEIEHLVNNFKGVPVIAVSDSSFHDERPDMMKRYAIDPEIADKHDIKRWGFHGLSVGSVVRYMKGQETLPEKLIVCHIGSGSSVTAVFEGKSLDTTMGYTPLEGVMMATRTGSMDVAAALALKRSLGYENDRNFEEYLNKKCGLLGVSGQTDDMREILRLRDEGDKRGTLAHAMYVYRLQSAIGQMAASLGGVDALVFTATIGERSEEIRRVTVQKLAYLGLALNTELNAGDLKERAVDVSAEGSKPVWVIKTDESGEMIRRGMDILNNLAA